MFRILSFLLLFGFQSVCSSDYRLNFIRKTDNINTVKIKGRFGEYAWITEKNTNKALFIIIKDYKKIKKLRNLIVLPDWGEVPTKPLIENSSIALVIEFYINNSLVDECRLAASALYYEKKWYQDASYSYEKKLIEILTLKD